MLNLLSLNLKPPYFYFTRGNNSCLLSSCGRELEGSTFSNTFSTDLSTCFRRYLVSLISESFCSSNQLFCYHLPMQPLAFGFSCLVGQQSSPYAFHLPKKKKKSVNTCIYYRFHFYSLYFCHFIVFLFLYSLFPLEIPLFCKIVGSGHKHIFNSASLNEIR